MTDKTKKEGFKALGLDRRLLQALSKSGLKIPTAVQEKTVPVALEKKDVLLRAKTGSGKTLAFVLPLIENILRNSLPEQDSSNGTTKAGGIKVVILVPTRELVNQIGDVVKDMSYFCADVVSSFSLTGIGDKGLDIEKPRLLEQPKILICTPARLANHLKAGNVSLAGVEMIVVDEADLMMTHDFEQDIKEIMLHLTSARKPQMFMCSATLNPHTTALQKHFLMHHPTFIQIDHTGFDESKLSEYYFEVDDFGRKFLVMYALFKLGVIKGKCIVFVHSIDLSYRLKLFLERFLIPSAVLNPALPYNSRQSVIDRFNRGLFKYLITTDAIDEHDDTKPVWKRKEEKEPESKKGEEGDENAEEEYDIDDADETLLKEIESEEKALSTMQSANNDVSMADKSEPTKSNAPKGRDVGVEKNKELMPHRGVDFREVAAVINFSCPLSIKKYIHRIGRTARAGHYGVAITLVTPREMRRFRFILLYRVRGPNARRHTNSTVNEPMAVDDPASLTAAQIIQKLPLSTADLLPFQYRCESIRCAITSKLVKQARLNELKLEVLNSKRLQSHFKERQREFQLLRHDKMLQSAEMVKPYLSHVSTYLIADTKLKPPADLDNANLEYKKIFGKMPLAVRERRAKKALRRKMKLNPALRRKVYAARKFNLAHPLLKKQRKTNKSNKPANLFQSQDVFKKATLAQTENVEPNEQVYVRRINTWQAALKQKLVVKNKRKPCIQGMSKSQIQMIRKRAKLKKLSKRRK